jgi:hypothetical protein
MQEVLYSVGPRILEDGRNLDADFSGGHFTVLRREITDPVSDGSLGVTDYAPNQLNKDGSLI